MQQRRKRQRAKFYQFSSVQSLDRLGPRRGHEGRFSRDPLPVVSAEGHCGQFLHGQGCPLFDAVLPAFPLPTTASPTLFAGSSCLSEAEVVCRWQLSLGRKLRFSAGNSGFGWKQWFLAGSGGFLVFCLQYVGRKRWFPLEAAVYWSEAVLFCRRVFVESFACFDGIKENLSEARVL